MQSGEKEKTIRPQYVTLSRDFSPNKSHSEWNLLTDVLPLYVKIVQMKDMSDLTASCNHVGCSSSFSVSKN